MKPDNQKQGTSGGKRQHEVGLILDKDLQDRSSLDKVWTKDASQTEILSLQLKPYCVAPTAEAEDNEINAFRQSLDEILPVCKSNEINLTLGDFSARVDDVKTVGPFGLGVGNERGDRLVDWCKEHDLL